MKQHQHWPKFGVMTIVPATTGTTDSPAVSWCDTLEEAQSQAADLNGRNNDILFRPFAVKWIAIQPK